MRSIMDPPRAGSSDDFIRALAFMKPKKIIYISCNPVTLKRDLEKLTRKGYEVKNMIPVDMFPGTHHVETVCLLTKK